jgi:hypothetical protein
MSNSTGTNGAPLHAARLPFGDESSPAENTTRFPGILEGHEKELAEAVVNMVLVGGGISFAGTADGGAISVTVFYGRERQKKYAASPEALQALLEAITGWSPAKPVEMRPRPAGNGDRRR